MGNIIIEIGGVGDLRLEVKIRTEGHPMEPKRTLLNIGEVTPKSAIKVISATLESHLL